MFTGIWWLINMTSTEDMVLNGAALSFVMDLDEVLFITLVTESAKSAQDGAAVQGQDTVVAHVWHAGQDRVQLLSLSGSASLC